MSMTFKPRFAIAVRVGVPYAVPLKLFRTREEYEYMRATHYYQAFYSVTFKQWLKVWWNWKQHHEAIIVDGQ